MKKKLIRIISSCCLLKYRLFYPNVKIGKGVITGWKLKIKGPGQVNIANGVNMWAFAEPNQLYTYKKDAVIRIGQNTRLNGVTIQARQSVEIGANCLIGSAIIMDNDFHSIDPAKQHDKSEVPTKAVTIGNNVWLAGQSAILKGVEVGDNAVVGFRSVVTKSVTANTVVVGNPAREIKTLTNS